MWHDVLLASGGIVVGFTLRHVYHRYWLSRVRLVFRQYYLPGSTWYSVPLKTIEALFGGQ